MPPREPRDLRPMPLTRSLTALHCTTLHCTPLRHCNNSIANPRISHINRPHKQPHGSSDSSISPIRTCASAAPPSPSYLLESRSALGFQALRPATPPRDPLVRITSDVDILTLLFPLLAFFYSGLCAIQPSTVYRTLHTANPLSPADLSPSHLHVLTLTLTLPLPLPLSYRPVPSSHITNCPA